MCQSEKPPSFEPPIFDETIENKENKAAIDLAYKLGVKTIQMKDLNRRYYRLLAFSIFCFAVAFVLGSFWFYQEVKSY
jgi:hypothetical protein